MALEIWDIAAGRLRKNLGQNNFKSWIEPLQFIGESAGTAEFSVPTSFFGNYVMQHFGDQILYHICESGSQAKRVAFSVCLADPAIPKPNILPIADKAIKAREIQGAKLDSRFLFDNFVVGKPNELAHAAAKRVAEAGPATFNPLFLYDMFQLGMIKNNI